MSSRGVVSAGGFKDLPGRNVQAFREAFERVHPDIRRIAPLDSLNVFVFDVTDLRELCLCQPSLMS